MPCFAGSGDNRPIGRLAGETGDDHRPWPDRPRHGRQRAGLTGTGRRGEDPRVSHLVLASCRSAKDSR